MSEAHFGALVPCLPNDKMVTVDYREIEDVTSNGNGGSVIHLKNGQRIETYLTLEGVQKMMDDARKRIIS